MSNGMEGAQDRGGPGDVEPNQFCTFACQSRPCPKCHRDDQYCWDVVTVNNSNNSGLFMNHLQCGGAARYRCVHEE